MRSALGCAALGLALLLVAGTFDAEPLYVTGAALILLGGGSAAWIGLGAWGATVRASWAGAACWRSSRCRCGWRPAVAGSAPARLDRRAAAARAGQAEAPAARARAYAWT